MIDSVKVGNVITTKDTTLTLYYYMLALIIYCDFIFQTDTCIKAVDDADSSHELLPYVRRRLPLNGA